MRTPWLLLNAFVLLLETVPSVTGQESTTNIAKSDLMSAAGEVFQAMKTVFSPKMEVAIMGGAAVQHYVPELRTTQDIDIYFRNGPLGPEIDLVKAPNSKFFIPIDGRKGLWYKFKNLEIQVDFVPFDQTGLRYKSSSIRTLESIPTTPPFETPILSDSEVVVNKIDSINSPRRDPKKIKVDLRDAKILLQKNPNMKTIVPEYYDLIQQFAKEQKLPPLKYPRPPEVPPELRLYKDRGASRPNPTPKSKPTKLEGKRKFWPLCR